MTSASASALSPAAAVRQWVGSLAPDRQRLTAGRVARDLADRSVSGVLAYEFLLLIILLATPYPAEHSLLAIGFIGAALLVGLFRLFAIRELRRRGARETQYWARMFHVGALLAAVVWSAFLGTTMRLYPWAWPMWLTLFCSSGLAAGAATSLSPDLTLTRRYLAILFVPAIALLLADRSAQGLTLALVFGTYLAFLLVQTGEQFDVYWRGVRESEHLEARTVELHEMSLQQERELAAELERLTSHLLRVHRLETTATLATAARFELDRMAGTLADEAASGRLSAQSHAAVTQVATQAEALARQLREQALPGRDEPGFADLRQTVRHIVDSLEVVRRTQDVDITLDLPPAPVRVRATRSAVELILVNLLCHIADALERSARQGQRITIRVSGGDAASGATVTLQDHWAAPAPAHDGPAPRVTLARQVLAELGGTLTEVHTPGDGTTVTVSVPLA